PPPGVLHRLRPSAHSVWNLSPPSRLLAREQSMPMLRDLPDVRSISQSSLPPTNLALTSPALPASIAPAPPTESLLQEPGPGVSLQTQISENPVRWRGSSPTDSRRRE